MRCLGMCCRRVFVFFGARSGSDDAGTAAAPGVKLVKLRDAEQRTALNKAPPRSAYSGNLSDCHRISIDTVAR
jgi:hypothetical protein